MQPHEHGAGLAAVNACFLRIRLQLKQLLCELYEAVRHVLLEKPKDACASTSVRW